MRYKKFKFIVTRNTASDKWFFTSSEMQAAKQSGCAHYLQQHDEPRIAPNHIDFCRPYLLTLT